MTTPIEDMQAAIDALRREVEVLKADAAERASGRQQVQDTLRNLRPTIDPKPRETGGQHG